MEGKTIFPGQVKDFFNKSFLMRKYFKEVDRAEKKFFSNSKFILDRINTKFIKHADLNHLKKNDISKINHEENIVPREQGKTGSNDMNNIRLI